MKSEEGLIPFNQESLIFIKTGKLHEDFKIIRKLGAGSYSEVFLLENKMTKNPACVKVVDKKCLSGVEGEDIMNEIKTLSEMDHPNIMKILGYYDTKTQILIVSEYLSGGELFERIIHEKKFTEMRCAQLMDQILSAVSYVHKQNIVHRDLKPENICFETKNPDSLVKIIDFGTSRRFELDQKFKTKMGTVYYIAPEVLNGEYNFKCDIWSCGVLMYVMLFGIPPFNAHEDQEIFKKIKKGEFKFPEKITQISPDAKDLIIKMLTMDPNMRPTAQECLKHTWFSKMRTNDEEMNHQIETLNLLEAFQTKNNFQKAILLYYVTFFDLKEERAKMLKLFKEFDVDHDGQISKEEILNSYKKYSKIPNAEEMVEKIFNKVDVNHHDQINFTEFMMAACDFHKCLSESELKKIFNIIDKNGDGTLSVDEIAEFFKLTGPENLNHIRKMMKEIDTNSDGIIQFSEFVNMMSSFLSLK